MKMLSIEEAKDQLAALVEAAERGEEIVITRNGTPVVELRPKEPASDEERRQRASARLRALMAKGFDLGGRDWDRGDLHERR